MLESSEAEYVEEIYSLEEEVMLEMLEDRASVLLEFVEEMPFSVIRELGVIHWIRK